MVEIKNNTKLNQTLRSLIEQLRNEADLITSYLLSESSDFKSEVFDTPKEFDVDITDLETEQKASQLRERKGIYIFIAKKGFEFTAARITEWRECKGAPINSQDKNGNMFPFKVDKKRAFYLGSCYNESLYSRVKEHCLQNEDVETASLKLNHEARKWAKEYLKVCCFPIKLWVNRFVGRYEQ